MWSSSFQGEQQDLAGKANTTYDMTSPQKYSTVR